MDRRKFNGGNSTKSNGPDKRKNEWKDALDKAGSVDDLMEVLRMLHDKAVNDRHTKAASINLSY